MANSVSFMTDLAGHAGPVLPGGDAGAAAVLLFVLVNVIVTLPYGAWRGRMHAGRGGGTR